MKDRYSRKKICQCRYGGAGFLYIQSNHRTYDRGRQRVSVRWNAHALPDIEVVLSERAFIVSVYMYV